MQFGARGAGAGGADNFQSSNCGRAETLEGDPELPVPVRGRTGWTLSRNSARRIRMLWLPSRPALSTQTRIGTFHDIKPRIKEAAFRFRKEQANLRSRSRPHPVARRLNPFYCCKRSGVSRDSPTQFQGFPEEIPRFVRKFAFPPDRSRPSISDRSDKSELNDVPLEIPMH